MVNIRDFIDSNSSNLSKGDKVIGEDVSNVNTGSRSRSRLLLTLAVAACAAGEQVRSLDSLRAY